MILRKVKSESGSVFLEAAIAVPVFFVVVMLFLDFSRYVAARSLLNASAQEALSLAAVIQGVEGDQNSFDAAEFEVYQRAYAVTSGTFVDNSGTSGTALINNVVIDIPDPGPEQKGLLESEPVSITILGEFEPLFPLFPNITMEVKAAGYREPRTDASLPTEVDCNNREASSPYYGVDCPCTTDTYSMFRNAAGECQCSFDTAPMADGSCGCIDNGGPSAVKQEPSNRTRCGCVDDGYRYDDTRQLCVCSNVIEKDPNDPSGDTCASPVACADPNKFYSSIRKHCYSCSNFDAVWGPCGEANRRVDGLNEPDYGDCDCNQACSSCNYGGQTQGDFPDDCKCSCGPGTIRSVSLLECVCNIDCPIGQVAVRDEDVLPWACTCEDEESSSGGDGDNFCDPSLVNCNGGNDG